VRRAQASTTASRGAKADKRKHPSPLGPKPAPGMVATWVLKELQMEQNIHGRLCWTRLQLHCVRFRRKRRACALLLQRFWIAPSTSCFYDYIGLVHRTDKQHVAILICCMSIFVLVERLETRVESSYQRIDRRVYVIIRTGGGESQLKSHAAPHFRARLVCISIERRW
jgi:hypothetical protein